MVAKSVKWALASLVVFPSAAFALGLGDLRLLSSLNAPLDAEIELVGATPEELASLKAQLASKELFARNGLDWPTAAGAITITPQTRAGWPRRSCACVLRSRLPSRSSRCSSKSIRSAITLFVNTRLLLDPPVFAPGEQQNAPVAAPSTGAGAREGAIARQQTASARGCRAAPAGRCGVLRRRRPFRLVRPSSEGGTRTVRSGETLSGIASEVAGDASQTRATMLAIYQNNRSAFEGNMNVLRSGFGAAYPQRLGGLRDFSERSCCRDWPPVRLVAR